MNLPFDVLLKLDEMTNNISTNQLRKVFEQLSSNYLHNEQKGDIKVCSKQEVLVYALTRMPATYGANYEVLVHAFEFADANSIHNVISLGSGTGSDVLACSQLFPNVKFTSIEKEVEMIELMKSLLNNLNVEYINKDLTKIDISNKADLIVASYSLNELDKDILYSVINKIIDMTNKYILIVEPATPKDFLRMKNIREYFISKGLYVVAPCLHNQVCNSQWCHFSVRVNRTKIHKLLKSGSAPYEDEKYTYLFISKTPIERQNECSRLLRHPMIYKGYVEFEACNNLGNIEKIKVSKKDNEKYKLAKKLDAGDLFS